MDGSTDQSYISRRNLPYTRSFPAEADQGACPLGFTHVPRITALIRQTDWRLMRHSLCEKTIQGWYMTICYV